MVQVRVLQLVLDEHASVVARIAGYDVGAERPDVHLGVIDFELNADRRRQVIQVCGEPRRGVVCFVSLVLRHD